MGVGRVDGIEDDGNTMSMSLLSEGEDAPLELDADFTERVEEGYDVDDALDAMGTGWFQYRLVFLVALLWMNNGLATMVTPFFLSGMRKDMSLDATQEGIVAASVLVGMIAGNFGIGMAADLIGRKKCIQVTALGVGAFTAASFFGQEWWHIAALRVGVGICVAGSMVPSNSLVSEVLPREARGRWLTCLHIFWQLGTVAVVVINIELHGRKEWRELMLASGIPSIFITALILIIGMPESPRFLLLMKRRRECLEVLAEMSEMNGVALPADSQLRDVPPHPKVNPVQQVLGPSLFARTSLPLWVMFFWLNYASYGNIMWMKAYFGRMEMDDLEKEVYFSMSMGRILGIGACSVIIDFVPRRALLRVLFALASVFTFTAVMMHGGNEVLVDNAHIKLRGGTLVLGLFTLSALFEEASWGAIYTYAAEVYPSSVRTTGSGLAMSVGRFGGIVATSIGRKLMEEDPRLPFYMTALAFLFASFAAYWIQIETKGARLAEV